MSRRLTFKDKLNLVKLFIILWLVSVVVDFVSKVTREAWQTVGLIILGGVIVRGVYKHRVDVVKKIRKLKQTSQFLSQTKPQVNPESAVAIRTKTHNDAPINTIEPPIREEVSGKFVIGSDGTVTDYRTGLMWMRCVMGQSWDAKICYPNGSAQKYKWNEAMALRHSFAGYDDWRLPSIDELKSVFTAFDTKVFPDCLVNPIPEFWSSSLDESSSNHSPFSINVCDGRAYRDYPEHSYRVRLVRGGQPLTTERKAAKEREEARHLANEELEAARIKSEQEAGTQKNPLISIIDSPIREEISGNFVIRSDGTVTDTSTGLMWMRCSLGQTWNGTTCTGNAQAFTWDKAMALRHNFAGHDDWRLPDSDELKSLVDTSQTPPAINNIVFPNVFDSIFWSASPEHNHPTYAKMGGKLGLAFGRAALEHSSPSFKVRLVRGKLALGTMNDNAIAANHPEVAAHLQAKEALTEHQLTIQPPPPLCEDASVDITKVLPVGDMPPYPVRVEPSNHALSTEKNGVTTSTAPKLSATTQNEENMSTGTYEELLPCGGKLKVSKSAWEISYYFLGPDMRYNGTFVSVQSHSVEQYISAFYDNWAEYEQLMVAMPKGSEFSKNGKMGMSIRIGNFAQGVCLHSYHMPITSAQQLEKIIGGYRYAAHRAPKIQGLIASLDDSAKVLIPPVSDMRLNDHVVNLENTNKINRPNLAIEVSFDSIENATIKGGDTVFIIYLNIINHQKEQVRVELPFSSYVTCQGEKIKQDRWLNGLVTGGQVKLHSFPTIFDGDIWLSGLVTGGQGATIRAGAFKKTGLVFYQTKLKSISDGDKLHVTVTLPKPLKPFNYSFVRLNHSFSLIEAGMEHTVINEAIPSPQPIKLNNALPSEHEAEHEIANIVEHLKLPEEKLANSLAKINDMGETSARSNSIVRTAIDFIRQQPELFATEIAELRAFLGETAILPIIAPVDVELRTKSNSNCALTDFHIPSFLGETAILATMEPVDVELLSKPDSSSTLTDFHIPPAPKILFDQPLDRESAHSTPEYQIALLTLQLSSIVAMADGDFCDVEKNYLQEQILSWSHLSADHQQQLIVQLELLKSAPASLASLKKKLDTLDASARVSIAEFAATVAQADGVVHPAEVKILEKIYTALGLDPNKVFSDLHVFATEGKPSSAAVKKIEDTGFTLDPVRIIALQRDTEKVSALLANIFKEEEVIELPVQKLENDTPDAEEYHGILGLDKAHALLARELLSRPQWCREELLAMAANLELMPVIVNLVVA